MDLRSSPLRLLTLALALGAPTLGACADEALPDSTPSTTSPESTADENADSPAPAEAAASYTYSCQGEATPREAPSSQAASTRLAPAPGAVGLRCVGGAAGTRCGAPDAGPCAADDARFTYVDGPLTRCGVTTLWVWDGTACVGYPHQDASRGGVAVCTGGACPSLPTTKEACDAAHAACGT